MTSRKFLLLVLTFVLIQRSDSVTAPRCKDCCGFAETEDANLDLNICRNACDGTASCDTQPSFSCLVAQSFLADIEIILNSTLFLCVNDGNAGALEEQPTPQPTTPQPTTPQPTTPQPTTPQPTTPQPTTPQPTTPQPTTPQPTTPEPTTPQPNTPQPSTPQPTTPQPVTPQPATPSPSIASGGPSSDPVPSTSPAPGEEKDNDGSVGLGMGLGTCAAVSFFMVYTLYRRRQAQTRRDEEVGHYGLGPSNAKLDDFLEPDSSLEPDSLVIAKPVSDGAQKKPRTKISDSLFRSAVSNKSSSKKAEKKKGRSTVSDSLFRAAVTNKSSRGTENSRKPNKRKKKGKYRQSLYDSAIRWGNQTAREKSNPPFPETDDEESLDDIIGEEPTDFHRHKGSFDHFNHIL